MMTPPDGLETMTIDMLLDAAPPPASTTTTTMMAAPATTALAAATMMLLPALPGLGLAGSSSSDGADLATILQHGVSAGTRRLAELVPGLVVELFLPTLGYPQRLREVCAMLGLDDATALEVLADRERHLDRQRKRAKRDKWDQVADVVVAQVTAAVAHPGALQTVADMFKLDPATYGKEVWMRVRRRLSADVAEQLFAALGTAEPARPARRSKQQQHKQQRGARHPDSA